MSICFLACNSVAVTFSQLFSVANACNYWNIRYWNSPCSLCPINSTLFLCLAALPILHAFHSLIFVFVLNIFLVCPSPEGRLYPSSSCLLLIGDSNLPINLKGRRCKSACVSCVMGCTGKSIHLWVRCQN